MLKFSCPYNFKKYPRKSQTNSFNIMPKCLGKLIYFRIHFYIEHDILLFPYQFRFRKKKSCFDCLTILTAYMYTVFCRKECIVSIPSHIKGAFDSVNPNILLNDLLELNWPYNVRMFVFNLLHNKSVMFKSSNAIKGPFFYIGSPQGCIRSPWNIYIYTRHASNHG